MIRNQKNIPNNLYRILIDHSNVEIKVHCYIDDHISNKIKDTDVLYINSKNDMNLCSVDQIINILNNGEKKVLPYIISEFDKDNNATRSVETIISRLNIDNAISDAIESVYEKKFNKPFTNHFSVDFRPCDEYDVNLSIMPTPSGVEKTVRLCKPLDDVYINIGHENLISIIEKDINMYDIHTCLNFLKLRSIECMEHLLIVSVPKEDICTDNIMDILQYVIGNLFKE